jgi:hypothetical protein
MEKKLIITEGAFNRLRDKVMSESYSDKVLSVKKFLDGNYMRGEFVKDSDGSKKTIGVFIKLTDKGLPTKDSVMIGDVFDRLQHEKQNMFQDKKERDEFLMKAIKAWYDHKINDRGSILA